MTPTSNVIKTVLLVTMIFISIVFVSCSRFQNTEEIARIGPDEARAAVVNNEALLVCAYDDDACKKIILEGAILRSELESKLPSLPNSQTIIFYCGWANEASSASLAAQYVKKGYYNAKALKGGIDGWEAAGYALKMKK